MSRIATDWAWGQQLRPSMKLILLSMADRAGEDHECYPSIKRLSIDTGLNRKTIISAINAMEVMGLIKDTGRRKGSTGRVKVYQIVGISEQYQKWNHSGNGTLNSPKNGTLNSPKNGTLNSPKNGTQNQSLEPVIEPVIEPPNNKPSSQANEGIGDAIKKWNCFAEQKGLQSVRGITPKRKKSIRGAYRLYCQTSRSLGRNPKSESDFLQALLDVAIGTHTEFHLGKNDNGWRMNFDYLLQQKIVDRVTEHGSITQ